MGLWNKLFGGADGCREAIRDSYAKHVRLAKEGNIQGTESPHNVGLYGALGTRYQARGIKVDGSGTLWPELVPFLAMKEQDAVEALAEYVVFQESPNDARIQWLSEMINSALKSLVKDSHKGMAPFAVINQVAWCKLLTPDTMRIIESLMKEFRQEGLKE